MGCDSISSRPERWCPCKDKQQAYQPGTGRSGSGSGSRSGSRATLSKRHQHESLPSTAASKLDRT